MSTAQTNLFACDDTIPSSYLESYPTLPPSRVMGMQPSTSTENMTYPESPPNARYINSTGDPRGGTGLGIQDTHLEVSAGRSAGMATAFPHELGSHSFSRQNPYLAMPQQYDMLQGYGAQEPFGKPDPESLDLQGRPGFDVVFPSQRTPSARRGPFRDHDQRERTAYTRKIGSCIRCRMQRIRVSLNTSPAFFLSNPIRPSSPIGEGIHG